jgi:hypothetical protein
LYWKFNLTFGKTPKNIPQNYIRFIGFMVTFFGSFCTIIRKMQRTPYFTAHCPSASQLTAEPVAHQSKPSFLYSKNCGPPFGGPQP